MPPLVVVDTNVIVAALRSRLGSSFALLRTLGDRQWRPAISTAPALEYEEVLKRPATGITLAPDDIDSILEYYFRESDLVRSVPRVRRVLSDPDDDRILEVAIAAPAAIVTFNVRDFRAAAAFGISALTPSAFLARLKGK